MIITGMAHFESVCKKKLVEWYNKNDDMYHTQQRREQKKRNLSCSRLLRMWKL